ncbi:hypothetical protein JAAARDRAFT_47044 [Jaapia argillacea MUCL 33604]|uniref:Uncharacterized protein n=1 Tax=Jaapia argillacea MUCL 33604 TaxID=933084 RepID=A0A067PXQ7_9AGAM|nr:hypothetical protein JAAARDRAFT_47044 [Jaapia argillacea MUCL 33604]
MSVGSVVPIVLQKVRKLHVITETTPQSVIEALVLPALRSLSVSYRSKPLGPVPPGPQSFGIPQMVQQSSCHLRALVLSYVYVLEEEMLEILSLAPSLEVPRPTVGAEFDYITEKFLIALTCTPSDDLEQAFLVPKLQHLTLETDGTNKFTEETLMDLIDSRWLGPVDEHTGERPQLEASSSVTVLQRLFVSYKIQERNAATRRKFWFLGNGEDISCYVTSGGN